MSLAQLNGTHCGDSGREQAAIPDPHFVPGNTVFGNRYPKAFKLRVLEETDACTKPGELGRYLRQSGLTHATLTCFRKQRASGALDATPNKRSTAGRTKRSDNAEENKRRMEETKLRMDLERENRQLRRQLEQAEMIIDIQKKVARLLDIPLDEPPSGRAGSRKSGRNSS